MAKLKNTLGKDFAKDWQEVESSNLKAIKYSRKEKKLFVKFHNGKIYSYTPISSRVYEKILSINSKKGESIGKYFITKVRDKSGVDYEPIDFKNKLISVTGKTIE